MQVPKDPELLSGAASIGASLKVDTTAQRLADVACLGLGGIAVVSLVEEIGDGRELPGRQGTGDLVLRRTAVSQGGKGRPDGDLRIGQALPPLRGREITADYRAGQAFTLSARPGIVAPFRDNLALIRSLVPLEEDEEVSLVCAPLVIEPGREIPGRPGLILGRVEVWGAEPFSDEDIRSLRWLAAHAAVSLDNAHRYTREHLMALTLQKGLLPPERVVTTAGEMAGIYLPAMAGEGLAGDWFDVIPLSSARVALVVGDVVGFGVRAAATMGRMCTAVHTLSDLDLSPDELLTHLDDLVVQLAEGSDPSHRDASGSTCVYAVVNPVTRRCLVASAGHPPPVVVRADGTARPVDLTPGPVLGVGGLAFDVTEVALEDGDVLALYADGLIKQRYDDLDQGLEAFREQLAAAHPAEGDLHLTASRLVRRMTPEDLLDDVTLLLARVRGVPEDDTASWEFATDPAVVAGTREQAVRQVSDWGLDDLTFATELVVSELVTNAIRYGGGEATLRLIREKDRLICEVSDPSSTAPHLKRAKDTDEGGRGLFIAARLVTRWGVRYGTAGKTIWTEQRLHPAGPG